MTIQMVCSERVVLAFLCALGPGSFVFLRLLCVYNTIWIGTHHLSDADCRPCLLVHVPTADRAPARKATWLYTTTTAPTGWPTIAHTK